MTLKIIAHRGAAGTAPENTCSAFQRAIELKVDGIELDVQRTRDGVLVICHDQTIDRTTNGHGKIADFTYDELTRFSAGGWFADSFRDEVVPTLAQVLALCPAGLTVHIEMKNAPHRYAGMERALADEIAPLRDKLNFVVSSFNHQSLLDLQSVAPWVKKGLLYEGGFLRIWDYAASVGLDVQSLHPAIDYVSPDFVAAARYRGLLVYPFTVDTEDSIRRAKEAMVDGVFTNFPNKVRANL